MTSIPGPIPKYDPKLNKLFVGTKYSQTATGADRLTVTITLSGEYIVAVEKYAKSENFNLKSGLMELIESGLIREGALPKWWRARQFDA